MKGKVLGPRGPYSLAVKTKVRKVIGGALGLTSSLWEAAEGFTAFELGIARPVFSVTLYQALHWAWRCDVESGRQGLCLEGALSSK